MSTGLLSEKGPYIEIYMYRSLYKCTHQTSPHPGTYLKGFRAKHLEASGGADDDDCERVNHPNNNKIASLRCMHAIGYQRGCNQRAQRASPRAARLTLTPRGVNSCLHTSFSHHFSKTLLFLSQGKLRIIRFYQDWHPSIKLYPIPNNSS